MMNSQIGQFVRRLRKIVNIVQLLENRLFITSLKAVDGNFSVEDTVRDDNMQTWAMSAPHCTEGYAPPEQYTTISNFYPQTDIYALAATLVFALTGRHLPDSRTLDEQEIRAFLPPAFPETYVQALIHALRPDINDRTESISDFREDLVAFYGGTRREQTDEDNDYDTDSRPPLYKRILAWLDNFRGCKK